jgi:hypothetical protein
MKLALAIIGEYINTIIRIIGFITLIPVIIAGLIIAQILAWFKI